jgi:hypothetical protein
VARAQSWRIERSRFFMPSLCRPRQIRIAFIRAKRLLIGIRDSRAAALIRINGGRTRL